MYRFMSYIQNYVEIKITGEQPQKFINICLRRRLAVWRLTRISDHEFTLFLLAGDFKKNVRSAARKSHVKVKILKKNGLIYTLRRYRARKTLLILSVLLAALFCMMSSMVWSIRIEGGDAADRLRTQLLMQEFGVKRGSLLSNINTKALAEQLLLHQKNLSWVGVQKRGMTLSVQLEEGTFYEEKTGESIAAGEPCNIAVSKDCLLYKVTVEQGTQVVSTGDTALAGQIVVSGEGKHAKADVLGCVWYRTEVEVRSETELLRPTGKTQTLHSLLLFGLKIDAPSWKWLPWNWGKEDFTSYDSIYSENYAGTDGSLPFGTATLIKRETKWETVSLTEEEAKIKARTEAESALDAAIPDDAQILRTSASFVERDGKTYYTASAEVLEPVGICVAP